jgi:hypothetical protein
MNPSIMIALVKGSKEHEETGWENDDSDAEDGEYERNPNE